VLCGEVIDFFELDIVALQVNIAKRLGYRLVEHKLELFAVPMKKNSKDTK
jgi:Fur family ferric uptake transcriptional regulator